MLVAALIRLVDWRLGEAALLTGTYKTEDSA
jgi:hypothetical protein